jgi:rhodanese-related sulfurtransferase
MEISMIYEDHRVLRALSKLACGTALAAAATLGFAADTPASLAGAALVTAEQAKKLVDSGVPIIDTRVANEYAEAHVKGAKSVPYKEKSAKDAKFDPKEDSFDLAKLPADKNAPLVLYCNAGECWKSYKASKVAIDAGYKKVNWLRGGFPEWKAKGYPVE